MLSLSLVGFSRFKSCTRPRNRSNSFNSLSRLKWAVSLPLTGHRSLQGARFSSLRPKLGKRKRFKRVAYEWSVLNPKLERAPKLGNRPRAGIGHLNGNVYFEEELKVIEVSPMINWDSKDGSGRL